jgi:DNA replication protein DnaC
MVNEATISRLYEMKLSAMASSYRQQMDDSGINKLSFDERFGLLVDTEWTTRKNNRLKRLIHSADFPISGACVEDIEYRADRKLDREQIRQFESCVYIGERHNIIIMGSTGAGKTYLSCALGMSACRHFYSVKYIRLPDLLDELLVARGEGIFQKVMQGYKKIDLLILDEWLLSPLTDSESRDLLEIVETRHGRCSSIFSSQFNPTGWQERIGEGPLAEAILDRIVHDSYTIRIDGEESMRKHKGITYTILNKIQVFGVALCSGDLDLFSWTSGSHSPDKWSFCSGIYTRKARTTEPGKTKGINEPIAIRASSSP